MTWAWDPLLPGGVIQQGAGAILVSIAVTPTPTTATVGGTRQFTATGTYDDLSTADVTATSTWTSSATGIATVGAATGLASGVAQGYATITATLGAISGTAVLGVISAISAAGEYQWVLAIEGYPWLLTDGDPQAVVAAWTVTDWATTVQYKGAASSASARVLGGLEIQLDHDQKLHPYQPFLGGPSLVFSVAPDPLSANPDQFGEDLAKRHTSPRVYLTAPADRDDTTIRVENTTGFDTASSSDPGLAFCGTESFSYTDKKAAFFSGVTRGLFSPHRSYVSSTRFAEDHRVGYASYSSQLAPLVTREMRTWKGRWVGLWLHTKLGGVLNTKANATLVYAGKIVEHSDTEDGRTVVDCEHVLDVIAKSSLLRDTYKASLAEGVYLNVADEFNFRDYNTTDGYGNASALRFEATESGSLQLAAGYYTFDLLCLYLSSWLAGEKAASRISGSYSFVRSSTSEGPRLGVIWEIPGGATTQARWRIQMPTAVAIFLGIHGQGSQGSDGWWKLDEPSGAASTVHTFVSAAEPYSTLITRIDGYDVTLSLEEPDGTFVDQTAFLPSELDGMPVAPRPTTGWGIFLIDERLAIVGHFAANVLTYCFAVPESIALGTGLTVGVWNREGHTLSNPARMVIRQILLLEASAATLLLAMLYSSGVTGYNHPTADVLGTSGGIGIPYGLLGTAFDLEVNTMPGADIPEMIVIDKSTAFGDLWKSSLLIRRAHLVWSSGRVKLAHWRTPVAANSVAALTEANKAEPHGNVASQFSVMRMSSTWAKSILRIDYGRRIDGSYNASFTIEDRTAIDDEGGQGNVMVIPLRNYYDASNNVVNLFAPMIEWHSYFSRPVPLLRRSIDMGLYFSLAPGDIVTVTDLYARSLTTGRRGITSKPAMVTQARWSPPSAGRPMAGEVEVAFLVDVEDGQVPIYHPSAEVDITVSGGGFTNGYNSATVEIALSQYEHSDSTLAIADVTNVTVGDKIIVVEIDPSSPAAPLYWERDVLAKSGNNVQLSSALTGYDGTKNYRLISQTYSAATTAQRAFAYQADVDGLVEDTVVPFLHGVGKPASATADIPGYGAAAHEAVHERYSLLAYGDGRPLDVGYERGMLRSVQNFHEHKSAIQSPMLEDVARTGGGVGDSSIYSLAPIFLQGSVPAGTRYLYVAPVFRSTSGATATVVVTLSDLPIPGGSASAVLYRGIKYVQATFTTTSTTLATATAQGLDLHVVPESGESYLTIEYAANTEVRGLGECSMREYV